MNTKPINQRTALVIAGGITAFTLVGLGALAGQFSNATSQATPTPAVATPPPTVAPVVNAPAEQSVQTGADSALSAREAQYQALIEEANRRIEEANRRLAQMEQQLAEAQAAPPAAVNIMAETQPQAAPAAPSQSAAPGVAISAQRALEIAQASALGAVAQRLPELVNFQGTIAYEVAFNTGMVYVDANSGAVLYNGALTQPVAGPAYYDDDDEHEREEREYKEKREDEHEKKEKKEKKEKDHDD
ncbi:MAG: hypothetical protein CUN48_09675 [Candidatus Thermofonsia Clade 3 bacterium]|jgi:hypothetical protein|uniref:PepSY domain-containing protein n=1 Tax=Candidatus Thermofonsia Clade 3 bacterium TaxID=2364212 RepID=A0A2M8QBS4_9CHLR|nr:PepSY domain-containing protein [Candidatus Roseilinea sp. NK_OTU-006]PJF47245.1 MAG: hypothetical protein CUN48_09675 [Candidatus Thermofonsia Clade 3 bacterium]